MFHFEVIGFREFWKRFVQLALEPLKRYSRILRSDEEKKYSVIKHKQQSISVPAMAECQDAKQKEPQTLALKINLNP